MFDSEYLASMLTTDSFLGYEELGEYIETEGR